MAQEVGKFPQSSNELDQWRAQGRTFSGGKWYEADTTTPELSSIEEQVGKIKSQIPSVQADVSALAEVDSSGAPPIDVNTGDVLAGGDGAATTGQKTIDDYQSMIDLLTKQFEQSQKDAAEHKKTITDLITKRTEKTEDRKSAVEMQQEARATALEQMGLTEEDIQKIGGLIAEVGVYAKQIADLQAQKQAALDAIGQKPLVEGIINIEQGRQERVYNSKIAAAAAQAGVATQQLQLLQGANQEARTTANQIVDLMTYDQQQELADMDWTIDTYQDLYAMETQEGKDAWDKAYTLTQTALSDAKENATKITDLMLASKGQAGITANDTCEDAVDKYNSWQQGVEAVTEADKIRIEASKNIKMVSIPTPGGFASVPVNTANINAGTVDQLRKAGMKDNEIRAWLDTNTKLTQASVNALLEKETTLEDVRTSTKAIFQQYKTAGYTRKQVEDQWKADNNATELTPIVEGILDDMFPQGKKWWEFWK